MKAELIKTELIDGDDKTLLISPGLFDDKLVLSIEQIGFLNPIKLIEDNGFYKVITGWKRLKICEELGINEILSKVYGSDELSKEEILKIIYFDNIYRLTELEKAELISKFKHYALIEDNKIIEEILPLLSINSSRKNLEKYLKVSALEKPLKEAFFDEKISFEQLQMLSEIEDSNLRIDIFENLLRRFRFNNNETRDLLKDTVEILNRDKISLSDLLRVIFDKLDSKASKNDFRKGLKGVRFPSLTEVEKVYKSNLDDLGLTDQVKIKHHPYFESNDLELSFKVKSSKDLRENLEKLSDEIDKGKVDRLLKTLREGK